MRTTIPAKDGRRAGDLLNRAFTACAPNRTWVMDFTYARTWAAPSQRRVTPIEYVPVPEWS